MEKEAIQIRLSVRTLVEFLLRQGSIDNRFGGFDRANEGARIHRKLQKQNLEQYGDAYQSEVFLSSMTEYKNVQFCIEGRADGILKTDSSVLIDEIKTTTIPLDQIQEDSYPVHWAQVQCYGYLYCLQNCLQHGHSDIRLQLTYVQTDTGDILRYTKDQPFSELEQFYYGLLKQYLPWAEFSREWAELRTSSIHSLDFPFSSYRNGQRKLAVAVYRTIAAEGRLFCQAPTGIGKTVSTLFPAVKSMGEQMVERIFYLTAKTITRQAAEEAFSLMGSQGLHLRRVTLTAKDKICFLAERNCNPEQCPYADGYYDRINDILFRFLQQNEELTRETIEACARANRLCPFEFALDCTLWCDAIICDYNYLFDPVVFLKRFFESRGKYAFLIDEAHNLVDRSRSMYSAVLRKSDFLTLKKELGKGSRGMTRALNQVNRGFLDLKELCGEDRKLVQQEPFQEFFSLLSHFTLACSNWLEEHRSAEPPAGFLPLYFDSRFFLRIAELYDEHYCTFVTVSSSEVTIKLLCLDPSALLDACMKKGRSAILFSATLSPVDYFASVLGGGDSPSESCKKYLLPSPFPQENLCLLLDDSIDTRYASREGSLLPIAERIACLIAGKAGNYLVFFPSYRYMNDFYETFTQQYPQVRTALQTSGMDETEREQFLEQFDADTEETLVGFCVLGGIYSEGIDLKGERLIGTAVVGVGLPQISTEQDILKEYYNKKNGMGFSFAYQYPGMNKVLQAAGRVIRGERDRGVVLLIDTRFSSPFYRSLFPDHWNHVKVVRNRLQLEEQLQLFWNENHTQAEPI